MGMSDKDPVKGWPDKPLFPAEVTEPPKLDTAYASGSVSHDPIEDLATKLQQPSLTEALQNELAGLRQKVGALEHALAASQNELDATKKHLQGFQAMALEYQSYVGVLIKAIAKYQQ